MKNTMKKLLALLLALVLTLALAACGQKEENKTDDQTNDPAITDQDNAADEKVTLPVADGAVIGQGAVRTARPSPLPSTPMRRRWARRC